MNHWKNLAGNDVSIFLFRFALRGNGIDFVLNQAIAADMYHDIDEKLKPLAHACCEKAPFVQSRAVEKRGKFPHVRT